MDIICGLNSTLLKKIVMFRLPTVTQSPFKGAFTAATAAYSELTNDRKHQQLVEYITLLKLNVISKSDTL